MQTQRWMAISSSVWSQGLIACACETPAAARLQVRGHPLELQKPAKGSTHQTFAQGMRAYNYAHALCHWVVGTVDDAFVDMCTTPVFLLLPRCCSQV
jgi:hypothetical protein